MVLHLPMVTGKFRLENGTSSTAAGGALLQFQQVQWVLIVYYSKKLPQATQNYGIMEVELTDLVCNICSVSQLIKHLYFKVLIDYR